MFRNLLFFGLIALASCAPWAPWQMYVDDQLIGQGLVKAAIIDHDGKVLAISKGFSLKSGEGAKLASIFNNPRNAVATGITIGGIKYLVIMADDQSIYGKNGAGGFVAVKTGKAIIIGVYDGTSKLGRAATIVQRLGDYIRDSGY